MQIHRTILFDLDGTLIDSTEAILESFAYAFDAFGLETPADGKITAEIGHPLDRMFLSLGVAEKEVYRYVETYKAYYRHISREKTTLLPGAEEAVRRAAEAGRVGVVTTKTATFSIELLEHMELMSYFEVLIGREDVEFPKPHPEPVLKALSAMGGEKERCWMIGDTCMDMHAARDAGVTGVGVTSGYGSKKALRECSTFLAESALSAVTHIVNWEPPSIL